MPIVAPSILASQWGKLHEEVKAVTAGGADWLHLDVMDGHFVPPITFGPDFVRACKQATNIPLDVHLMIEKPERQIEDFIKAGAAHITVHAEACPHLHRILQRIRELGAKAGVALNPGTPVDAVKEVVGEIDILLIMTVNPGWGGQPFIEHSIAKLQEASELVKKSGRDITIEVDGGVNDKTGKRCVQAGAKALVAGSFIFGQSSKYAEAIAALR